MILYVNGDSQTAAAQAANDYCFANDDFAKVILGRKPHPDNLAVSWGAHLSKMMKLALVCDAESFSSNERILRTTYNFLETLNSKRYPYVMVIIGWSSWDRTEFLNADNEYVQIIPGIEPDEKELVQQFKKYVRELNYRDKQQFWHNQIWDLHKALEERKIPHLFYNVNDCFEGVSKLNWDSCYIEPYDKKSCFTTWAKENNFVPNDNNHYGQDAHLSWARCLFNQLTSNNSSV